MTNQTLWVHPATCELPCGVGETTLPLDGDARRAMGCFCTLVPLDACLPCDAAREATVAPEGHVHAPVALERHPGSPTICWECGEIR